MNSTGQLYKLGAQVANADIGLKAGQKKIEMIKKKKAEHLKTKTKRDMVIKADALDAFKKFVSAGKPEILSAKDSKAILKFVLPLLAPKEKFLECNTGPKTMERLLRFGMDLYNKFTWISGWKGTLK